MLCATRKTGEAAPAAASKTSRPPAAEEARRRRARLRGLEAEISFLIGKDLPPREMPYTRDEVLAAIASCHPAIEELEAGLDEPLKVERLTMIGDLQLHGGFVPGPAVADWQKIDFAKESVSLSVDGAVRVERTASNTAGLTCCVW